MKTKTIKLYEFNELSEKAKQTALDTWSEGREYFGSSDAINSLQKFAEHFNCELKNYSIDFLNSSPSSVSFDCPDDQPTKTELKKLITSMGSYNRETFKGHGDCKFTGYCLDEDAADGARLAFFAGERNLKEILMAGYKSWYKAANADAEHQFSIEGFAEHCEGNDYIFDETGKRYTGPETEEEDGKRQLYYIHGEEAVRYFEEGIPAFREWLEMNSTDCIAMSEFNTVEEETQFLAGMYLIGGAECYTVITPEEHEQIVA